MNLKDKVIVITGASSGLGRALAENFNSLSGKVVISSNDGVELKKTSGELGVFCFPADVSKENSIAHLAAFALRKFGRIDIWINNAGITAPNLSAGKTNMRLAHKVMEVNFFGTFYGTLHSLEIMKKRRAGTIINIISVRALEGYTKPGIYTSSKWAARGFTEAIAPMAKTEGISVIAIYPGGMKTKLHGKKHPAGYDNFMEPEYVANKIIHNLKRDHPKKELVIKK